MTTTQSTKRPLEDPSSPSTNHQPDAKRPALDKIVKAEDDAASPVSGATATNGDALEDAKTEANGSSDVKSSQEDTKVQNTTSVAPTSKSIQSTGHTRSSLPNDESGWIHIRAVITSAEAATCIGKGGENVSVIRKMSGAKCTVSDYQKGAVERILTVSGVVDAVAKVCIPVLP